MTVDARPRRRTRRRLLLAGIPLVLVALAVQWKVATMLGNDSDGRADYAAGSYADAQDAFASNGTLNLVEAWISPYDDGTARYRLEDFAGAVRSLEDALATAPSEEECRVRINLALAHEAVGDKAAAGEQARRKLEAWQDALDVLEKGGCVVLAAESKSGVGSSSPEQVRDARTVVERLRRKLQHHETVVAEAHPTAQTRAELLAERNAQARRDQRRMDELKQDQADAAQDPSGNPGAPPSYEW
jgi:tetratricopeptide (TPR) repeat protein